MEFVAVSFRSVGDVNKDRFTIDVQDPHYDPTLFDSVMIENQLQPFVKGLMEAISRVHQAFMDGNTRSTDGSFQCIAMATPVPPERTNQRDEEQGLAPMEVDDQPSECSISPPDLFYIAFKFCDNEGRVFVIYQYKKKDQSILRTPAYKMASDGTTDEFLNLATCVEENPQLKVLLVDNALPLLLQLIEYSTGEDGDSSVESMDTSDGSPPKQDVDGLLGPEVLQENESGSKAKAVARCQDSGFNSMPHSVSMNEQLAKKEKLVADEAELAHTFSSEPDERECSQFSRDVRSSSRFSVKSVDTSDGSPPKQEVDGLLGPEALQENESGSKAKAVTGRQDSGFDSMPNSVSLNPQLANEEEHVGDEAELAHTFSSEPDERGYSQDGDSSVESMDTSGGSPRNQDVDGLGPEVLLEDEPWEADARCQDWIQLHAAHFASESTACK